MRSFTFESSQVNCMALSPDRTRLAVGGNSSLKLYDVSTAVNCPPCVGGYENQQAGNFTTLGFISVAKEVVGRSLLYSGSEDGVIRTLEVRSAACRVVKEACVNVMITCSAINALNQMLAVGTQIGKIFVWDLQSLVGDASAPKPMQEISFADDRSATRSIAFGPSVTWAAVATNNGKVHCLRLAKDIHKQQPQTAAANTPTTDRETISPTINAPDTDEGEPMPLLGSPLPRAAESQGPETPQQQQLDDAEHANSPAQKPTDAKVVVLTPKQAELELQLFNRIQAHHKYILRVNISPDGRLMATCSADYTIKLWSLPEELWNDEPSGARTPLPAAVGPADSAGFIPLKSLQGHTRWVWDCAFSECSKVLVTVSSDNYVRLWTDLTELKRKSDPLVGHQKPVTCVLFEYLEAKK